MDLSYLLGILTLSSKYHHKTHTIDLPHPCNYGIHLCRTIVWESKCEYACYAIQSQTRHESFPNFTTETLPQFWGWNSIIYKWNEGPIHTMPPPPNSALFSRSQMLRCWALKNQTWRGSCDPVEGEVGVGSLLEWRMSWTGFVPLILALPLPFWEVWNL